MERAGASLGKMKLGGAVSQEELAFAAWKATLGKRLSKHAWAKALVRGNLVIETEDAIWQQQLFHLRYQILEKVCQIVGPGIVTGLEFRTATPRRPPQQELEARLPETGDEADEIQDAIFRSIYKQAREKARA